jgi:uncharacterized protein (DUF362 family)/NAD-dependent dihydropyrimidine dehydrogenase PreA subunit
MDIDLLLNPFGGMKRFIERGDRVLLKVNLTGASLPETAAVTHPSVVREIAKSVINVGGDPFIGDSPIGRFSKRRLEKAYETSGLKQLASDVGIELNYDTRSKKIEIPKGKQLKKTPICNFFLNADKTIAIPKLKTHSLMIMSLATKIMYGVVPGLTKTLYHSKFLKRNSFAEMFLDLQSFAKPDLYILDGILGMQGDGPLDGKPIELGLLFASTNAIALDLSVCKMLCINPIGVPILKQAKVKGLWPNEIHYPNLSPEEVKNNKFILPSTAGFIHTGKKRPRRYPVPTEKCTGCGRCKEICPQHAIEEINQQAKVDYTKCIQCYCCNEVCSEGAIKLESIKSEKNLSPPP